jgi:hypothetical protein
VFLTKAAVQQPLHPVDDEDDRRRIATCGLTEAQPPWDLGHPPPHTGRAVRVPVGFTCWMLARATADRRRGAHAEGRGEPRGWPRWRRQRLEQTRAQGIVVAQRRYGSWPLAEVALLVGVKRKDAPPGIGTPQEGLAKYALTTHG